MLRRRASGSRRRCWSQGRMSRRGRRRLDSSRRRSSGFRIATEKAGKCRPELHGTKLNLGGLGGECLDARVEAALVAGGGVLVEDALLHALIKDRDSGAVGLGGG